MDKIRRHLRFHGDVQGVGFRWSARTIADRYGVSGWVRNCYDGTVEMEAEGTPRDIDCLVRELCDLRWADVTDVESETVPTQGGYGFSIR